MSLSYVEVFIALPIVVVVILLIHHGNDCKMFLSIGSLLIGRTSQDSAMLKRRVDQLSEAGLRAEFLSHGDLLLKEPALMIGKEGGAAFLPDDCQIDAQRAVSFIEKVLRNTFFTEILSAICIHLQYNYVVII